MSGRIKFQKISRRCHVGPSVFSRMERFSP
jgi:hypothetical protein